MLSLKSKVKEFSIKFLFKDNPSKIKINGVAVMKDLYYFRANSMDKYKAKLLQIYLKY